MYADTLEWQSRRKEISGLNLGPEIIDHFNNDQLGQLYELYNETTQSGQNTPDEW